MNCSTFALITIGISNSWLGLGRSFGSTSKLKSSLASSLIGKSIFDADWFPAGGGEPDSDGEGSSGKGGVSREDEVSDTVWTEEEGSSFVGGEEKGVF
jgi:hypothetical protein